MATTQALCAYRRLEIAGGGGGVAHLVLVVRKEQLALGEHHALVSLGQHGKGGIQRSADAEEPRRAAARSRRVRRYVRGGGIARV